MQNVASLTTRKAVIRTAEIMGQMVANGATIPEAIEACQQMHPGLGRIASALGPTLEAA